MGASAPIPLVNLDAEELRGAVERILANDSGRPVRIAELTREPSRFATLFPAEILTLGLETGQTLSLFVKHLGAEEADHPEKQCRDREARIYAELLRDPGLPVPRYYGSRQNSRTGRLELFLEHVDDWNLKYHGLEHWFRAAERLAQFHAFFAAKAQELQACGFLLRLDAAYCAEWAQRALAAVAEQSAELAASLEGVARRYDRVTDLLTAQPRTLVHNDLSPKNVLADTSRRPARICLIDWEMAGVGCGLLDLVHLKYGLKPADDRRMRDAYTLALAGTGLLPERPEELSRLFAACELHKTLYRLAFSKTWKLPIERVAEWVGECRDWFASV